IAVESHVVLRRRIGRDRAARDADDLLALRRRGRLLGRQGRGLDRPSLLGADGLVALVRAARLLRLLLGEAPALDALRLDPLAFLDLEREGAPCELVGRHGPRAAR